MSHPTAAPAALLCSVRGAAKHAAGGGQIGKVSTDHGLDALTFFLADLQTGFGPFIAVYLTAKHWSAESIGFALGVGTVVATLAQIPAGASIDATPAKRGATLVALAAVLASALLLAVLPYWWPVLGAEVLHGVASCMLVPAVAALTLSRVGRHALSDRLGRNTRFMAIGNAAGAGAMGLAGAYLSAGAPFWLTAASVIPAMLALLALPPRHRTQPRAPKLGTRKAFAQGWRVLRDRRLLAFSVCVVLFHAGNAFILPLAVNRLTGRLGNGETNGVLAGCLIVAQGMTALLAPWLARRARDWGRRPVLMLGFATVPVHAGLLAFFGSTPVVIGAQLFDGVGSAMFGTLQPLVAADITYGTNRYNLSLGVLGLAAGLGGTLSNTIAGHIATRFGDSSGFLALGGTGALAVAAVWLLMPETRDTRRKTARGPDCWPWRRRRA